MPAPGPRAPVEAIRRAVAHAVEARSLRSVAADVKMSPTGLRNFLQGRSPYSATLRRLTAWYLKHQLATHGFTPDVARAAVAVLLEAVPEAELDAAGADLLECVREIHHARGVTPPGWLAKLSD